MLKGRKTKYIFEAAGLVATIVVFTLAAWGNLGWDDEIFNMRLIESGKSVIEIVKYINSGDVHPIGQYVINAVLYSLLGRWRAVRVFGALLVSLSLWLYWKMTAKNRPLGDALFSYVFLCLSPSMILWCTSVRWYTWIIPPMCLLGAVLHMAGRDFTKKGQLIFWGCYYLLCVILFHIAYCSIVIILVSFACLLWERRKFFRNEIMTIAGLSILSAILVSYQAYAFLTVHLPVGSSKLNSMLECFVAAGQNFLCGSVTIPVSPAGIILILGGLALFAAFVLNMREIFRACPDKFLVLSYMVNIALKCAPGARYYSCLHPQMSDFMADSYSSLRNSKVKLAVLALFFVGNIWGCASVITHTDTAKGAWNTPYEEIFRRIEEIDPEGRALIATPNATIAYYMEKSGRRAIGIHGHALPDFTQPIIAVNTYGGSVPKKKYEEYIRLIETHRTSPGEKIGYDKYAWFKQKIEPNNPDYYAEIFVIGM